MQSKPIVLCVDDEPNVVESLALNLRSRYKVLTALSGPLGLEMLRQEPEVAVVVSDMRMPEMDGAQFLAEVKRTAPSAVRMLLTGYSDIDAAMRAVNEGQIFRFLTKPCDPQHLLATLAAGVEQHRLVTAERVLLQKTLLGSVKAVVEVMALGNPLALGRAVRIRNTVRKLCAAIALEQSWRVEFAALLSQLAVVSLADETVRKLYDGEPLDDRERRRLAEGMGTIKRILGNIPRLEGVTSVMDELVRRFDAQPQPEPASIEVDLLLVAMDLDARESRGEPTAAALRAIRSTEPAYRSEVLGAFEALRRDPSRMEVATVAVEGLSDGMVLCEDLKTSDGILVLPRGFAVNESSREHLANFAGSFSGTVRVLRTPQGEATGARQSA
jgi:CheY-like chemotaxis protein